LGKQQVNNQSNQLSLEENQVLRSAKRLVGDEGINYIFAALTRSTTNR
jgi:hypothetical protein